MDLSYPIVKAVHVGAAASTSLLFVLRAHAMLRRPEFLSRRWVRRLPHVVDTLLLLSGAWLAWQIGVAGVQGWLPAKLAAVVVYILLGMVALKRGRTRRIRVIAAIAAMLALAYIVGVALTHSAWGPLVVGK